jgi:hypothetical protein
MRENPKSKIQNPNGMPARLSSAGIWDLGFWISRRIFSSLEKEAE